MLAERDKKLDAEKASGQSSIWRSVYNSMRFPAPSCHLGPYCWLDLSGKKHHRRRTFHVKRLITHAEKGGILETHKDVPNEIHQELYMEEQQRLEKGQHKRGNSPGARVLYPSININVLPSQSHASGLDISAAKAAIDPASKNKATSPLEIPEPRDLAVKEYGEWQKSNDNDDSLMAAFRDACDVMLTNGLDFEQVHEDQTPEFFISKGIKNGIAWRFVGDVEK